MLDSGSAVSLIMRNEIITCGDKITTLTPPPPLKLITASGEPLPISGCVRLPVKINQLQVIHNFIVVDRLVAPVILGLDFLQQHTLVLNFAYSPVMIQPFRGDTEPVETTPTIPEELHPLWADVTKAKIKLCATSIVEEPGIDVIDECVIPCFASMTAYDMSENSRPCLQSVVQQFKQLFVTKPGKANGTYHYITTSGTPVKVLPRCIPVHYRAEIESQLQQMLDNHIIEESSNP